MAAIAAGIGNNINNLQVMRDLDDHHLGKQLLSPRARLTHHLTSSFKVRTTRLATRGIIQALNLYHEPLCDSSSSNRIKPPPHADQG